MIGPPLTETERMLGYEDPRPRPEEPEHPFRAFLWYQLVPIDLEHLPGDVRSGVDPDGVPWSVEQPAAYGEVRGTRGADGDPVDVYVGTDPFAPFVWVVQTKLPGSKKFDETKSMLGFATREEAIATFRRAYTKPGFILDITKWPIGAWRAAMARPEVHGGRMHRPLTKGRMVIPLSKAQQLGLFGPRPMVNPATGKPAAGGPTKVVTVAPHVRQTEHGAVLVEGHLRHLTAKEAFKLKKHELHAHVEQGGESAAVAQAELARRAQKRQPEAAPEPPAPAAEPAAPTPEPAPSEPEAPAPTPEPPAPEPARASEPEPAPAEEAPPKKKPEAEEAHGMTIAGCKPPPPGASDELRSQWKALKRAQADSLTAADRRGALPPGSTRARVTTANANWARAAEHRDKVAERYQAAYDREFPTATPAPAPPPPAPEPTPEPAPEPVASRPEPAPVATPETPEPTDAEKRGDGSIRDAGDVLWGARKHKWKRGERITPDNLDQVEALGEEEAYKAVTKKAVWGDYDHDADQGNGDDPACSYLKARLVDTIAPHPGTNNAKVRTWYVTGVDWLKRQLAQVHTTEELKEFIGEWKLMSEGHLVEDEVLTAKQIHDLVAPTDEERGGQHWGGSASISDYNDLVPEEGVNYSTGKPETRMRPRRYDFPMASLTRAGFSTRFVPVDATGEDGKRRTVGYRMTRPIPPADNPYSRYLFALGGLGETLAAGKADPRLRAKVNAAKLVRAVTGRGALWETHAPKARALEKNPDTEAAWTEVAGARRKGGGAAKRWERNFTGVSRTGGLPTPDKVDGDTLRDTFGFRGVQYGNWVEQEARETHLKHAHGALTDLAEIMGIEPKAIAHGGKLGLAFGARGGGAASAHYEPDQVTINLTHTKGAGTLAHEWGHFFDHQMTGDPTGRVFSGRTVRAKFASQGEGLSTMHPEVADAYRGVMRAIHGSEFHRDALALGDYWASSHELFARAFESYVEDSLHGSGRSNTYLVSGTRVRYGLTRGDAVDRRGQPLALEPYPHGPERATIGVAIDALVKAMSKHRALQKALARSAARRTLPRMVFRPQGARS